MKQKIAACLFCMFFYCTGKSQVIEEVKEPPPPPVETIEEQDYWIVQEEPDREQYDGLQYPPIGFGEMATEIFVHHGHQNPECFSTELLKKLGVKSASIFYEPIFEDTSIKSQMNYRTMRMLFVDGQLAEQTTFKGMYNFVSYVGLPQEQFRYHRKGHHTRVIHNWVTPTYEGRYSWMITNESMDDYLATELDLIVPTVTDFYTDGDNLEMTTMMNESTFLEPYEYRRLDPFTLTGDTVVTNSFKAKRKSQSSVETRWWGKYADENPSFIKSETTLQKDTMVTIRTADGKSRITGKAIYNKEQKPILQFQYEEDNASTTSLMRYSEKGLLSSLRVEHSSPQKLGQEMTYTNEQYDFFYTKEGLLDYVNYKAGEHSCVLKMKYQMDKD
ncbi:MAG: hypothetical protein ACKVOR_10630 [Flavobacteriales bacterium]